MKKFGILIILLALLLIPVVQADIIVNTPHIDLTVCQESPTQIKWGYFNIEYNEGGPGDFEGTYIGIPFYIPGMAVDLDTPNTGYPTGTVQPGQFVSGRVGATAQDYDGSIWPIGTYLGHLYFTFFPGGTADIIVETNVISCQSQVPEFPSALLPVTMIIGFLGVVFYIKRTREN